VIPIANPAEFANAAIELLLNDERWQLASKAAIARVERYYDEVDMIGRYQSVYLDAIDRNSAMTEAS
jgi:glycosyltransferase involved in cell wall biosynthesis